VSSCELDHSGNNATIMDGRGLTSDLRLPPDTSCSSWNSLSCGSATSHIHR